MDVNSNYGPVPTAYPYERDRSLYERDRLYVPMSSHLPTGPNAMGPTHLFSHIHLSDNPSSSSSSSLLILMVNYHREYELTVRQEPKQARMCGVGGKPLPGSAGPSFSPHAASRPSSH